MFGEACEGLLWSLYWPMCYPFCILFLLELWFWFLDDLVCSSIALDGVKYSFSAIRNCLLNGL